jgi:pilus assembly protein CpaD
LKERSPMRAPLWLAGLSLLALGACASDPHSERAAADPPPITPSERYPIEVQPAPVELKLGAHLEGLSPTQTEALRDFVSRWNDADRGPITVKAPSHGPDPQAVYRTATGVRDWLIAEGAPPDDVRIVSYDAATDAKAPVLVGFLGYQAKGPHCDHWGDLSKVLADNETYKEFGCSITANIAAQVADPADLLHPRATTAADASRRQAVLDKYRQGASTSTAKDAQASGAISTTGQ